MYVRTYVCMYVRMCVYVCMYVRTYACMYMYVCYVCMYLTIDVHVEIEFISETIDTEIDNTEPE